MSADLKDCVPGYALPPVGHPAISRTTLAMYAGASGDFNPIHIDIDAARRAGFPDVIAHGMLSAAYLGRFVTDWAGADRLRSYAVRFVGIAAVHDILSCAGVVTQRLSVDGEERLTIELSCTNQKGEMKVKGEAVVAVVE